jgi:hypothetical protein
MMQQEPNGRLFRQDTTRIHLSSNPASSFFVGLCSANLRHLSCHRKFSLTKAAHRSPLINRGYYSRVLLVRRLISQFISAARAKDMGLEQIVSLGAGMDSNFFNLKSGVFGDGNPRGGYFEVDMPDMIEKKRDIILRDPELHALADLKVDPLSENVSTKAFCSRCGNSLIRCEFHTNGNSDSCREGMRSERTRVDVATGRCRYRF